MDEPEAHVTRVYERFGCLFVEGVVKTPRGYLPAKFTVPKNEINHYTREQFDVFAKRSLPLVTVDKRYEVTA